MLSHGAIMPGSGAQVAKTSAQSAPYRLGPRRCQGVRVWLLGVVRGRTLQGMAKDSRAGSMLCTALLRGWRHRCAKVGMLLSHDTWLLSSTSV